MLSFIGKVTTGTLSLALFISNVARVVGPSGRCAIGWFAAGWVGVSVLFNSSDIMHSFDHNKSSSFSQFIKGKSRDLQKLL